MIPFSTVIVNRLVEKSRLQKVRIFFVSLFTNARVCDIIRLQRQKKQTQRVHGTGLYKRRRI